MSDFTEHMIAAFAPESIRAFEARDTESQWFAAVEALGFPYATPEQVGEIAAELIQRPDANRADLARAFPFQLFAVLSWAADGLAVDIQREVYSCFPGLMEALNCARARYGLSALLIACGVDPLKPSEAMIQALHPDRLKAAVHPDRFEDAAKALGLENLKPEQAGNVVHAITENYSEDERAHLVREHTAEVWTLLSTATAPYPETVERVTAKFPGLREAFNAATDRYGYAAMIDASGMSIH